MRTPTRAVLNKILSATVQAPSGDNVQPARFEVSTDFSQVDMFNVPERDSSYFNYLQLASYVAHGAMIENFIIAAQSQGFDTQVDVFPSQDDDTHTARFHITPSESEESPLYEVIFSRCTNRKLFKPGCFSSQQKEALLRGVEGIEGIEVSIVDQPQQKNALAKHLSVNDRMVFEHKQIHAFLFRQIRWNKQQVEETKDGMPIGTLGLNFIEEKIFFPFLRFWNVVRFSNLLGLSRFIGLKGWLACRSARALGMVTTTLRSKDGFLASGRAFQRLWLEATNQGMAFQPVTGITFLIQRIQDDALTGFSVKQQALIKNTEESMREAFNAGSRVMAVGFRLGYCDSPPVKTERKEPVVYWNSGDV